MIERRRSMTRNEKKRRGEQIAWGLAALGAWAATLAAVLREIGL